MSVTMRSQQLRGAIALVTRVSSLVIMLRATTAFTADLVCPERCAACEVPCDPRVLFCELCLAAVHRLGPPECPGCGVPQATDAHCPECHHTDTPVRRARAWARYDHGARAPIARAIARFKYHGARRLGRRFAAAIAPRAFVDDAPLLVPVPLHPRRLRARGFNQSAVIARHLGRILGCPVALSVVTRVRDTPSQVTRATVKVRGANVDGAFVVARAADVRDRVVLIVDDVWTSGATVHAVARSLRMAGARAVDALTIARVP